MPLQDEIAMQFADYMVTAVFPFVRVSFLFSSGRTLCNHRDGFVFCISIITVTYSKKGSVTGIKGYFSNNQDKFNFNTWKIIIMFGKRRIIKMLIVMGVENGGQDSVPIAFYPPPNARQVLNP